MRAHGRRWRRGSRLAHESRRRAEEEEYQHACMRAEEESPLVEEARLKSEEEYLWLKSEDKVRLVE